MQEYAVYSLTSRLSGDGAPASTLIRFDVELSGCKKSYPVLISKTVAGTNLKEVLAKQPNKTFDQEHLTHQLLLGLLTHPGDGRASNFIVTGQGKLICIDNDVSFVEPIVKARMGHTIHFTSVLHCLTATPLKQSVLEEWSKLSPDLILAGWIEDLMKREEAYTSLFSPDERKKLYEEDPNLQFTSQLLVKAGMITTLYTQLTLLQKLYQNPPANGLDLLKHLIVLSSDNAGTNAIGPLLHRSYEKHLSKPTPGQMLQAATGRIDTSITTPRAFEAALGKPPTIEQIEKKESFSLEKLREEFLAFTLLRQEGVLLTQKGSQGSLQVDFSKITKEGQPDLERQELMLRGLQLLFGRPEESYKGKPQKITLAHCAVLTAEKLVPFLHKDLTYLDVRGSSVESMPPEIEACPLNELYLTGCKKLTSLGRRPTLFNTPLNIPTIEILHIDNCPQLTSVLLDNNRDLLKEFKANDNPKLTKVALKGNLLTTIGMRESPPINLERLFLASYPEFPAKLDYMFGKILGGCVEGIFNNKDSNQKQQKLGEGLLVYLRKTIECESFKTQDQVNELVFKKAAIGADEAKAFAIVLPKSQVTTLDITNGQMGVAGAIAFAEALSKSRVTSLILRNSALYDAGAIALAEALPKSQVTSLSLEDYSIRIAGVTALAEALSKSQVTSLNIEGRWIYPSGVITLAKALPKSRVTSLNLGGNSIEEPGAIALAEALPSTQVTSLNLWSNKIGVTGTTALAKALPKSQVTSLDLTSNSIGNAGAIALAEALPSTQVTSLDLGRNSIEEPGAIALAEALPSTQVTSLDLGHNSIEEPGAIALAEALPKSQVTSLILRSNEIGVTGTTALAKALPKSQVTLLNLASNSIGNAGAIALAEALPKSQVTSLTLWSNKIGVTGTTALAKALPKSQVTLLNLASNSIGNAGAIALAEALPSTQVTSLDLGDCSIEEPGAIALAEALPKSQVTSLDLRSNNIGEIGKSALSNLRNKNGQLIDVKF